MTSVDSPFKEDDRFFFNFVKTKNQVCKIGSSSWKRISGETQRGKGFMEQEINVTRCLSHPYILRGSRNSEGSHRENRSPLRRLFVFDGHVGNFNEGFCLEGGKLGEGDQHGGEWKASRAEPSPC